MNEDNGRWMRGNLTLVDTLILDVHMLNDEPPILQVANVLDVIAIVGSVLADADGEQRRRRRRWPLT